MFNLIYVRFMMIKWCFMNDSDSDLSENKIIIGVENKKMLVYNLSINENYLGFI